MSILDFIGPYKTVVIAVGFILSFGGGFYAGEQSVVRPYANATVNAQSAQASADAKQGRLNTADSAARVTRDKAGDQAAAEAKAVAPKDCPKITGALLQKLNDPRLTHAH